MGFSHFSPDEKSVVLGPHSGSELGGGGFCGPGALASPGFWVPSACSCGRNESGAQQLPRAQEELSAHRVGRRRRCRGTKPCSGPTASKARICYLSEVEAEWLQYVAAVQGQRCHPSLHLLSVYMWHTEGWCARNIRLAQEVAWYLRSLRDGLLAVGGESPVGFWSHPAACDINGQRCRRTTASVVSWSKRSRCWWAEVRRSTRWRR